MKIIIDTHIFLWLLNDPNKVEQKYMKHIEDTQNDIFLSAMSVAELMIKKSIGKLDIDFDVIEMVEDMGIEVLDFKGKDALYLGTMPFHHRDPFDRMIISQAISNNYFIISDDRKFNLYDCKLI